MIDTTSGKRIFSGHESFQCRALWLKKGYDFVSNGLSFTQEDAVVALGVGKNMVAAIRFWMKAFGILTPKDEITELGHALLSTDGWDPYLEDDASLWLLHYQLVKNNYASTYNIIFNEFRREKLEFTRESYVAYVKMRSLLDDNISFTQNTVEADFDVFKKMYLFSKEDAKNGEDSLSGLLCDLKLVKTYKKESAEWNGKKEVITRQDCYYIENAERPELPPDIFLYAIADNPAYGNSIGLRSLEGDLNSPASIFALDKNGIVDKINELTNRTGVSYNDQAGIKELQFKKKPNALTVLKQYYEG